MALVHLLSAAAALDGERLADHDLNLMRASADADRFGVHRVVEDPAAADVVLFVETQWAAGHYFERVRRDPVLREFRSKSYLYSSVDKVIPFVPGVFASIEAPRHHQAWTRSGHYLDVRELDALRYDETRAPTRLFSFVGAAVSHPLRQRILRLEHPQGLLIDATAESLAIERRARSPRLESEWRERFADSVLDSAFVLCPRGGGPSSRRLFEAMMLGRAPVVISDRWVAPEGPDWESFCLRVPEARVEEIPRFLEARSSEAEAMGARARRAWLDWFSEAASFHRTVEWCLALEPHAAERGGLARFRPHLQLLRPYHGLRVLAKRLGHRDEHGSPYWDTPLTRLRHRLATRDPAKR